MKIHHFYDYVEPQWIRHSKASKKFMHVVSIHIVKSGAHTCADGSNQHCRELVGDQGTQDVLVANSIHGRHQDLVERYAGERGTRQMLFLVILGAWCMNIQDELSGILHVIIT